MTGQSEIVYVVQGPGVRLGRRVYLQGRAERMRDGRRQICVEVSRNGAGFGNGVSRAQWFDAALVFEAEADARDMHRRARDRRAPGQDVQRAAIELRDAGRAAG